MTAPKLACCGKELIDSGGMRTSQVSSKQAVPKTQSLRKAAIRTVSPLRAGVPSDTGRFPVRHWKAHVCERACIAPLPIPPLGSTVSCTKAMKEEITLAFQLSRSYKESRAGDEEEPTEGQHQLGLWSPTVSTTTRWNADFMRSVAGPDAG